MKNTLFLASLLLFLAVGSLFATESVQILSMNVRLSTADDKDDRWEIRKDRLLAAILERNYDFLGGQEVVVHQNEALNQIRFLTEKLPQYGVLYLSREKNPNQGEGTPVFFRKDRWKIDETDQGTFWLSDTPEVPGSVTWEGQSTCPRVCSGGLFHELDSQGTETGKALYVYSTHFDHVGEISRQKAAALILQRIAGRKNKTAPVVLIGDFNCGENSPAIRFLKGETVVLAGEEKVPPFALLDTFRVVHPEEKNVATFHNFKGPKIDEQTGLMIGDKIDYIFVTPEIRTTEAEILRVEKNGRFPSDHFFVRATLDF